MSSVPQHPGQSRTVQDYIDELPMWPDGTRLQSNSMTSMQRRIWMLAAAGKFFGGEHQPRQNWCSGPSLFKR